MEWGERQEHVALHSRSPQPVRQYHHRARRFRMVYKTIVSSGRRQKAPTWLISRSSLHAKGCGHPRAPTVDQEVFGHVPRLCRVVSRVRTEVRRAVENRCIRIWSLRAMSIGNLQWVSSSMGGGEFLISTQERNAAILSKCLVPRHSITERSVRQFLNRSSVSPVVRVD